jgi:hypothetical protein
MKNRALRLIKGRSLGRPLIEDGYKLTKQVATLRAQERVSDPLP